MPSIRIADFDTWRPGYGAATVKVLQAGTSSLASVYSDEDLTVAASNPQTLSERIGTDGISYGRFQAPVYVGVPYELLINNVDTTGVQRPPLITLEGEDASLATVQVSGGSQDIKLEDTLARKIDVRDFGEFRAVGDVLASRATNTTTLTTAIGVAGGRGGARVGLPAGTYQVSNYTLSAGVVLEGEQRDSTILQSNTGGAVATIGGDGAGHARLTLDGVTQVALSVGVLAVNRNRMVFEDVLIKRFETGLSRDGGAYTNWNGLSISDCVTGYKGFATTAELTANRWTGGGIALCSTRGLDLEYNGAECDGNQFSGLFFDTNTGTAAYLKGAKATALRDCIWSGNTNDLTVLDYDATHQVIGLEVTDGVIDTGALTLTGYLKDVAFRRMRLTDINVTLTTPTNNVLVEDCQSFGVAVAGIYTAWLTHDTTDIGASFGETPGSSATKAWAITLQPGDMVYLEAKVIGRQINGVNRGYYHFSCAAYMAGSSLAYDTQTGNFTKGNTLTGQSSGATATIQNDSDGGATGTLTLVDIVGAFVDDEIITDGAGGSATVNGTLSVPAASISSGPTDLFTPDETNAAWAATFVANGPQIELRVTGASSSTIEWTSQVTAFRN